MRVLVVAALVGLSVFAGCLDDEDSKIVTARDALGPGQKEAKSWHADAALVSALGFELSDRDRQEISEDLAEAEAEAQDDHAECLADADDDEETQECHDEYAERQDEIKLLRAMAAAGPDKPGDGRASVWIFAFRSESAEAVQVVAVVGDQVVLTEEDDAEGWSDDMWGSQPLTDWGIDSSAAAQIARDGDEAFAAAARSNQTTGFYNLFQMEDGPVWLIGLEDRDDEAFVAVDAVNGTLIPIEELFEDLFQFLVQESGVDTGQFTAVVGGSQGTGFSLNQDGHGALVVHVSSSPAPTEILVTVTLPDGSTQDFTVPMALGLESQAFLVLRDVPSGPYEVRLDVDLALQQQWQVSWCTDGFGFDLGVFFSGNPACEEVPNAAVASTAWPTPSETISRWVALVGP